MFVHNTHYFSRNPAKSKTYLCRCQPPRPSYPFIFKPSKVPQRPLESPRRHVGHTGAAIPFTTPTNLLRKDRNPWSPWSPWSLHTLQDTHRRLWRSREGPAPCLWWMSSSSRHCTPVPPGWTGSGKHREVSEAPRHEGRRACHPKENQTITNSEETTLTLN